METFNLKVRQTTHQEMVSALVKDNLNILDSLTPYKCGLIHMSMGISGESGELLDAIKKHVIYEQPLDLRNVREELGDLEFYLEGLRQLLNLTREECLNSNIAKLAIRYEGLKYTNQQAKERRDKCND